MYYQPQPAKFNQHKHYFQGRGTQQACYKYYYDRYQMGKRGNIHSGIPHMAKKYPLFHW